MLGIEYFVCLLSVVFIAGPESNWVNCYIVFIVRSVQFVRQEIREFRVKVFDL